MLCREVQEDLNAMGTLAALCQGTAERGNMRQQLANQLAALAPMAPYVFTTSGHAAQQLMTLYHCLLPSTGGRLSEQERGLVLMHQQRM